MSPVNQPRVTPRGQDLSILSYDPELEDLHILEIKHWRYTEGIAGLKQIAPCGPSGWVREKPFARSVAAYQVSGNLLISPGENITSGTQHLQLRLSLNEPYDNQV